jgi:transcriptional regulator with XRE-family HTH domain
MTIDHHQVARRISALMLQLQSNQKQFAEKLQVTQPAISKYLQGRIPPPQVLLRMSQLGGTSMEWLLTGESSSSATNRIAENQVNYGRRVPAAGRIDRLPPALRKHLSELIDLILWELK